MTTIWMKPKDYKFYQYPRGVNKGGVLATEICPTISCSSWENNCLLIEIYGQEISADLHLLLLSEKITPVNFRYKIELGFLLVCAILLLLSYVFRYGEELQRLSDETL